MAAAIAALGVALWAQTDEPRARFADAATDPPTASIGPPGVSGKGRTTIVAPRNSNGSPAQAWRSTPTSSAARGPNTGSVCGRSVGTGVS